MLNKHFEEIINHYIFLPGSRKKKWQQKFRKNTFYVTMVTQQVEIPVYINMTVPCKDEYAEDEIKSYRVFAFVFLFCMIKKNPTAKYV